MEPKDRLRQAIEEAGYDSPTEAWRANQRALGIGKDLFISNCNGNRAISRKSAEKYANVFGRSAGWYLYGDEEPASGGAALFPAVSSSPDAIEVPVLAMVSAGALLRDDVSDVRRATMRFMDLPPGDWIALDVEGTSMDRVSPPGSRILVNRKDKVLVPNACYVIDDGEGNSTYKRYRPDPDRFEAVSTFDHPTLFPENEPRVIGRVRFSILPM